MKEAILVLIYMSANGMEKAEYLTPDMTRCEYIRTYTDAVLAETIPFKFQSYCREK